MFYVKRRVSLMLEMEATQGDSHNICTQLLGIYEIWNISTHSVQNMLYNGSYICLNRNISLCGGGFFKWNEVNTSNLLFTYVDMCSYDFSIKI